MQTSGDTKAFLITTVDNPWNPFTNFDDWNSFDTEYGYRTWQRIDKLMPVNYLRRSEGEINALVDEAMNSLVRAMPTIYMKVYDVADESTETVNRYRKLASLTTTSI